MKRINPHWLKSLIFHLITLMIATFVGIDIVYDKAFGVGLFALWLALISPLAYPIVGPYMVAFFSQRTLKSCNCSFGQLSYCRM